MLGHRGFQILEVIITEDELAAQETLRSFIDVRTMTFHLTLWLDFTRALLGGWRVFIRLPT